MRFRHKLPGGGRREGLVAGSTESNAWNLLVCFCDYVLSLLATYWSPLPCSVSQDTCRISLFQQATVPTSTAFPEILQQRITLISYSLMGNYICMYGMSCDNYVTAQACQPPLLHPHLYQQILLRFCTVHCHTTTALFPGSPPRTRNCCAWWPV